MCQRIATFRIIIPPPSSMLSCVCDHVSRRRVLFEQILEALNPFLKGKEEVPLQRHPGLRFGGGGGFLNCPIFS
jgi:hypothetical protein